MSRFDKDSAYLVVRRWVDHDIAHHHRAPSVSLSGILTISLAFALVRADGWVSRMAWLGPLLLSLAWTGFVLWRAWRVTRAVTIKGDRQYDRKTKFKLPPDYSGSESVLAASRRRRQSRR